MSKKKQFTELVSVMLKPETLKQLQEATDALEISNSEFIRDIIKERLNKKNFNLKKQE